MADPVQVKDEFPEETFMDEIAEDESGDLEFYDKSAMDPNYDNMYLARVPHYVWEAWAELPDDANIQVGKIRQWYEPDAKGEQHIKLRMLLDNGIGAHQMIPKEYDLRITEMTVKDTFIFSEEDLPEYKEKNRARREAAAAGIPAHLLRNTALDNTNNNNSNSGSGGSSGAGRGNTENNDKPQKSGYGKGRKGPRKEFYRKAVPKKTKIAGRIKHELNSIPVDNPETDHLLALRALEAAKPKAKVAFQDETNISQNSINRATDFTTSRKYQSFITANAAPPPVVTKQKKTELKAARIPENELLDQIFQLFRKFSYYHMKTLRVELRQPEAYLRQTLEKVAVLHKSGNLTNTWGLTDDAKRSNGISLDGPATVAPTVEGELKDDDDEEDIKMEDVP
ncbi:hypothetical protein PspLS_07382 [Pyricularia sp. CBS 133598]|nr:hypothetical protein PspLS_07382 [Pyricularia sp. CBS 133598]